VAQIVAKTAILLWRLTLAVSSGCRLDELRYCFTGFRLEHQVASIFDFDADFGKEIIMGYSISKGLKVIYKSSSESLKKLTRYRLFPPLEIPPSVQSEFLLLPLPGYIVEITTWVPNGFWPD